MGRRATRFSRLFIRQERWSLEKAQKIAACRPFSGGKFCHKFAIKSDLPLCCESRYNSDMRRWPCIAAFSLTAALIMSAVPVWGQRHGGSSGGGHFSAGSGFAGHSLGSHAFASHSFAGRSSGSVRGSGFSNGAGVRLRIGNNQHNRYGINGRRGYYPFYPYAGYYPYGYYGWDNDGFYSDNGTGDQDSYSAYQGPSYSDGPAEDSGLHRDVQSLSGKIDRLQADVEARNQPKASEEPKTALVFRDQHVEEVRNYAISGGMVWVFREQAAKKIPLAQLDIPATVKMNDDRGVDFQVPEPSLQIMIVR